MVDEETRQREFNLNSFIFALNKIDQNINTPEEQIALLPSRVYLQAIALELIIKIFYRLDTGQSAPTIHAVDKLFADLKLPTQELIRRTFDYKIGEPSKLMPVQIKEVLYQPSFEEMLTGNAYIVKDFKYAPKLQNGSLLNISFLMALQEEIRSRIRL